MRLPRPCFVAPVLPVLLLLYAGCRMGGLSAKVDKSAIRISLDKYVASIDSASSEAARQVWAQSDDVSFIHPLGHERGFEEIRANFYEKLMSGMFSSRKLSIKNVEI